MNFKTLAAACLFGLMFHSFATVAAAQTCGCEAVRRTCKTCTQGQKEITIKVVNESAPAPRQRYGLFRRQPVNIFPASSVSQSSAAVAAPMIQSVPMTYSTVAIQPMMTITPTTVAIQPSPVRASAIQAQSAQRSQSTDSLATISKRLADLSSEVRQMGKDLDSLITVVERHEKAIQQIVSQR